MIFYGPSRFAAAVSFVAAWASAEIGGPAEATGAELTPQQLAAGVADRRDVVVFPPEVKPGPRPVVQVATRVAASEDVLNGVLANPNAYRAALPALVRADAIDHAIDGRRREPERARKPEGGNGRREAGQRKLAWELEVPLFNLKGTALLTRTPEGVELRLLDGDFAPGSIRFRVAPIENGRSLLTAEAQLDVRSAGWLLRRIARHNPWAETAMTATATVVLARAVAEQAEARAAGQGGTAPRPSAPIAPPPAHLLDGKPLGSTDLARSGAAVLAWVHRGATGRLAWASVAVPVPREPRVLEAELDQPAVWQVVPGWKRVRARAGERQAGRRVFDFEVTDGLPLIDLDARWRGTAPPVRATVVEGSTKGAVLGWDVLDAARGAPRSVAVLSLHPHLDEAGFVERRLIAAEPLLEHGLSVALAYVYAAAVRASLAQAAR